MKKTRKTPRTLIHTGPSYAVRRCTLRVDNGQEVAVCRGDTEGVIGRNVLAAMALPKPAPAAPPSPENLGALSVAWVEHLRSLGQEGAAVALDRAFHVAHRALTFLQPHRRDDYSRLGEALADLQRLDPPLLGTPPAHPLSPEDTPSAAYKLRGIVLGVRHALGFAGGSEDLIVAAGEMRAELQAEKAKRAALASEHELTLQRLREVEAKLRLVATPADGVWRWAPNQAPAETDAASLSCPVVMSAERFRELLAGRPVVTSAEHFRNTCAEAGENHLRVALGEVRAALAIRAERDRYKQDAAAGDAEWAKLAVELGAPDDGVMAAVRRLKAAKPAAVKPVSSIEYTPAEGDRVAYQGREGTVERFDFMRGALGVVVCSADDGCTFEAPVGADLTVLPAHAFGPGRVSIPVGHWQRLQRVTGIVRTSVGETVKDVEAALDKLRKDLMPPCSEAPLFEVAASAGGRLADLRQIIEDAREALGFKGLENLVERARVFKADADRRRQLLEEIHEALPQPRPTHEGIPGAVRALVDDAMHLSNARHAQERQLEAVCKAVAYYDLEKLPEFIKDQLVGYAAQCDETAENLTAMLVVLPHDGPTPEIDRHGIAKGSALALERARQAQAVVRTITTKPLPEPGPVPMRLHCPACGELHIDEGAFATKVHHTHACQACGEVWRPAVVATKGVRFLPGFKNEPTGGSPTPATGADALEFVGGPGGRP